MNKVNLSLTGHATDNQKWQIDGQSQIGSNYSYDLSKGFDTITAIMENAHEQLRLHRGIGLCRAVVQASNMAAVPQGHTIYLTAFTGNKTKQ